MSLRLTASLVSARLHRIADAGLAGDAALVRYARAVWSAVAEPGDGVAGRLIAAVGPVRALEVAQGATFRVGDRPPDHVSPDGESPGDVPVGGRSSDRVALDDGSLDDVLLAADLAAGRQRWAPRLDEVTVGTAFERGAAAGARLIVPEDPEWPRALDDLGDHAPACLWLRGDRAHLGPGERMAAIVGARAATPYGEHVAGQLAGELVGGGVTIVSGAAYGIDGVAHRAALRGGGTTIALLAGGIDRPYPADHAPLLEQIVRSGVVASEVPCGTSPTKWRFLMRNRLIAALAGATVVVEAGWRSGSLNTAGHAAALGRPLGAVPGPITSGISAGCHRLLREYDAQCITSADDVRELLGLDTADVPPVSGAGGGATRTRIADALSMRTWRDTAEVARLSGLSHADAQSALGLLELESAVESSSSGWRLVAR
jgi:DNA processing protein